MHPFYTGLHTLSLVVIYWFTHSFMGGVTLVCWHVDYLA